jgi:transposase-like protein
MNNLLKMKRKHDKMIDDLLDSYGFNLEQGTDGSIKLSNVQDISKDVIRRMLDRIHNAELDAKLGYKAHDQNSRDVSDNYRNGNYAKTVKTSNGTMTLAIPRDRKGEYAPQLVPKFQTNIVGLESKIINLIQDGVSYQGIQNTLKDMYTIDVDPHAMSAITDRI